MQAGIQNHDSIRTHFLETIKDLFIDHRQIRLLFDIIYDIFFHNIKFAINNESTVRKIFFVMKMFSTGWYSMFFGQSWGDYISLSPE